MGLVNINGLRTGSKVKGKDVAFITWLVDRSE